MEICVYSRCSHYVVGACYIRWLCLLTTSWLPVTWTGGNKIKMVMKNGRCIHSVRNFSVT